MILVLILAFLVSTFALAMAILYFHARTELASKDLEMGGLAIEVERQKSLAASMVTPLTWIHQGSAGNLLLRQAVTSAFSLVQSILLEDDQEMAQRIEVAPDPPRRLPKYPIIPAYLASAEDVAMRGAPQMPTPESIVSTDVEAAPVSPFEADGVTPRKIGEGE